MSSNNRIFWALIGFVLGVVLPNLNAGAMDALSPLMHFTSRVLEEHPEYTSKDEESVEEDENPVLEYTIVVGIVLLLIALTILFEYSKDYLEESSSRDMLPLVESLFGELTVLGFLSIFTFVITKAGFFMRLGETMFGPDRHEELLEVFESVHYTIFFIMISFVIQVLILVEEAKETEEEWLDWERKVRDSTENWTERAASFERNTTTGTIMRWIRSYAAVIPCWRTSRRDRENMYLLLFKALRDEFVLDRELAYPFSPAQERVDQDFNFGRYLGFCQANMLQKVVHVKISTWFLFAVMVFIYYLFVLLVHCNETVRSVLLSR